jgi:A118 family predicted phage portal protein
VFKRFLIFLQGVIEKMIGNQDIKNAVGLNVAISDDMADALELWSDMYINEPPWKTTDDIVKIRTMGIPSLIASEVARMVTIENKIDISGSVRADFIKSQISPLLAELRKSTEYACALGGIVFKPYVNKDNIEIDIVQADCFFPISFNARGEITQAAFVETKTLGKTIFKRIELHRFDNVYTITNKAFRSMDADSLGREIPLENVEDWADIEPVITFAGVDKPFFSYFAMPLANTIDTHSPIGVSIYSRAAELIEQADKQYSRLLWEMEATEAAVDADISATEYNAMPELQKRLFRNIKTGDTKLYEPYLPNIRDVSQINALNELLMRIEDTCGIARGTISNVENVAKTATEIKILKQRTYATVVDTQKALQTAIENTVYAIDALATYYKLAPAGKYEISCEWDDSTIVDIEQEFARRLQLVSSGLLKGENFISWYFGCDEKTALAEFMPTKTAVLEGD